MNTAPDEISGGDAPSQTALRVLAESAARAGGEVALRFFKGELNVRLKPDRSEVSEADEETQAVIIAHIRAARPHDTFVAEERLTSAFAPEASDAGLCWIIDPIDGTRNFIRHIPLFAACVGVMHAGIPIAGAIYVPVRGWMYSGSLEEGVFLNGERVSPGEAGRPRSVSAKPVVAVPSTPYGPTADLAHAWLDRFASRSLGSTALHMAMVASGELDAMIADNPRVWDVAAGWAMILASGGRVVDPRGAELFPRSVEAYHNDVLPFYAFSAARHPSLEI